MIEFIARTIWKIANILVPRFLIPKTERARVIIVHKKKILLTKTLLSEQRWSLVGGGIHRKEQPIDGAIREVFEEVGIKLSQKQLKPIGVRTHEESGTTHTFHYFACVLKDAPKLKKRRFEIIEAEWFSVNDIPENTARSVGIAMDLIAPKKS